jgi:WD40 repeat protein
MRSGALLWPIAGVLVLAGTAWVHAQPHSKAADGPPVEDLKPRKPIEVATGHPTSVYRIVFSPDGKELATASSHGDPRVRFWDPRTGRLTRTLEAHPRGVWAVAYTPDGTRLVTSGTGDRGDVFVWDARTHRKLLTLHGHKEGALSLAISPDGKRLASIAFAVVGDVAVWDLESGRLQNRHPTLARSVERAAFLADGRTLLVSSRHGIRVWDLGAAGGGICDLGDVETGRRAGPEFETRFMATAAIGPGGRVVADGDLSRTTRLLDVLTGREVLHIQSGFHSAGVALSPDGRTIARPSSGGTIELLDWPSERTVLTLGPLPLSAWFLAFSPDGKRLAVAGSGSKAATIYLWDVSDIADRMPPQEGAGPKDLDRWCKDLASADAGTANRALWRLVGARDQAVTRLKTVIHDKRSTTPADIARWIAELDDDRFAVREAAAARLTGAGTVAMPPMEAALKEARLAEQRRRLQTILAAIRDAPVPADRLFAARARVVLERIGTPEARRVLEEWAKAVPGTDRAAEARDLAKRLAKQQAPRR